RGRASLASVRAGVRARADRGRRARGRPAAECSRLEAAIGQATSRRRRWRRRDRRRRWRGTTTARELEGTDARLPVEGAIRGDVLVRVPEGATIGRVNRHRAVVAPTAEILPRL